MLRTLRIFARADSRSETQNALITTSKCVVRTSNAWLNLGARRRAVGCTRIAMLNSSESYRERWRTEY
jgi:hypothetical protein